MKPRHLNKINFFKYAPQTSFQKANDYFNPLKNLTTLSSRLLFKRTRKNISVTFGQSNHRPHKLYQRCSANNFFPSELLPASSEQKWYGPQLPVLEDAYTYLSLKDEKPDFNRTLFICGQHLLNTTVSLFEFYIRFGAKPENIYVIGKNYSNSPEVIQQIQALNIQYQPNSEQDQLGEFEPTYDADVAEMIKKVAERLEREKFTPTIDFIVVPDDGGHVLTGIRRNKKLRLLCRYIIGIEQTSSGIASSRYTNYPVIELATSAIKRWTEPSMIATQVAKNVVRKLQETFHPAESQVDEAPSLRETIKSFVKAEEPCCAVVGAGYIGQAILNKLIHCGIKRFFVLDEDNEKAQKIALSYQQETEIKITAIQSLPEAISKSDLIAGCTGKDITGDPKVIEALETRERSIILFSCGSKDKEGATLLRYMQSKHVPRGSVYPIEPLANKIFKSRSGADIVFLRGLFPLNFDNSPESVPASSIQVIRGLKAMATVQAYFMLIEARKNGSLPVDNYQLDVDSQLFIIQSFQQHQPETIKRYPEEVQRKLTDKDAIAKESGGKPYIKEILPIEDDKPARKFR